MLCHVGTQTSAEAALVSAQASEVLALATRLVMPDGSIVMLTAMPPRQTQVPLARLVSERSISTNTAAAGGNASLMTPAARAVAVSFMTILFSDSEMDIDVVLRESTVRVCELQVIRQHVLPFAQASC